MATATKPIAPIEAAYIYTQAKMREAERFGLGILDAERRLGELPLKGLDPAVQRAIISVVISLGTLREIELPALISGTPSA